MKIDIANEKFTECLATGNRPDIILTPHWALVNSQQQAKVKPWEP